MAASLAQPNGLAAQTPCMHTKRYDALLFREQHLSPSDESRVGLIWPHDKEAIKEERWQDAFHSLRAPECTLVAVRPTNIDLIDHFGITTDKYVGSGRNSIIGTHHLWHMDVVDREVPPPYVCGMMMHVTPETCCDTLFANTSGFLDTLHEDELERLKSIKISRLRSSLPAMDLFTQKLNYEGTARIDDLDAVIEKRRESGELQDPVYKPLMIHDPLSGKDSLLLSPYQTYMIEGMTPKESRDFIQDLCERCCSADRVYRHEWQPLDFIIWANRMMGAPEVKLSVA
ncbi:hypothetical protein WJX73_001831 [Symbiochloris irregularis]|uniref:TauD/TfdA-like domain-containing protein n=1 Tax=Symbiochloris irregularis TaxID=706552 RepID=A0AAW1PUR3_9CHLO